MTYPNARVINYNYNTGLDSNISRLSSISDSDHQLAKIKTPLRRSTGKEKGRE